MYEELENIENPENLDSHFELDDSQQQLVDLELNNAGGEELLADAESQDVVVEIYDKVIRQIRPDLKTAVNLSPMKSYSPTWNDYIDNYLESPYLEAFSDREQVEYISDYMSNIEDIRFENWKDLSLEQKVNVLNEMEHHIAAIEHRPAATISSEKLEDNTFGYQSNDSIVINSTYLEQSSTNPQALDKMLETLIHEGRHRYQQYNVEERLVHESPAQVETWRENFEELGYKDGSPIPIIEIGPIGLFTNERLSDLGFRLYYYQPVEVDARNFASDVMSGYHKKMEA